jgi:RNA polymerase II subunit A small phosphatase-like protein
MNNRSPGTSTSSPGNSKATTANNNTSSNATPTTSGATATGTTRSSGIMTQVQRGGGTTAGTNRDNQMSVGVTYAKGVDDLTQKQLQEYRALLRQSTNRSPVNPAKYLPLLEGPKISGKKTLILDVDETLVHSSYERSARFDLHIPCCTDPVRKTYTHVFVAFRPFLKEFLDLVTAMFEVVIFTASVEIYCRPLMEHIDPQRKCAILWRDHCTNVNGLYVKDLSLLGRDLNNIAIIDNSPHAYLFQPRNAIPITSWFDNPDDRELMDIMGMLEQLSRSRTVYDVLDVFNSSRELVYP